MFGTKRMWHFTLETQTLSTLREVDEGKSVRSTKEMMNAI